MESHITAKQAYKAMFVFVKKYYYRKGKPDEIGNLLSDLQLLSYHYDDPQRESNGDRLNTADPASWDDWIEAVGTVLKEENESNGA